MQSEGADPNLLHGGSCQKWLLARKYDWLDHTFPAVPAEGDNRPVVPEVVESSTSSDEGGISEEEPPRSVEGPVPLATPESVTERHDPTTYSSRREKNCSMVKNGRRGRVQ